MEKFVKNITAVVVLLICISLIACSKTTNSQDVEDTAKPEIIMTEEDLNRKIHLNSELATLEIKYNNVAIGNVKAKEGFGHWGEKDRSFWVEYSGTVKLGCDLSKVNVVVKNESVIVTIPEIQIIGNLDWETSSAREYITPDSKFNSNKISPDVKNQTVNRAQKDMKEKILNDEKLCSKAEENLKNIIESYVKEMSRLNGVEYKIEWEKQSD